MQDSSAVTSVGRKVITATLIVGCTAFVLAIVSGVFRQFDAAGIALLAAAVAFAGLANAVYRR